MTGEKRSSSAVNFDKGSVPILKHYHEGVHRLTYGNDLDMSEATVRGFVHLIEETKEYGQKGFKKRLVVLEQDTGRFTNYIPIEFVRDACESADELSVGQEIEMTYRLQGRRWQKDSNSEVKFFLNAEAISFKVLGSKGASSDTGGDPNAAFAEAGQEDDPDSIPF